MENIKVIGFDADDTLWVNENYFREAEETFCNLMAPYCLKDKIMPLLYEVEMDNLDIYGFGIKGFVLSMLETTNKLCHDDVPKELYEQIIQIGKSMLSKPVELLGDVEEVLKKLSTDYKLILATKGDLLDQQRKLDKSGLSKYFHHVEVMSNKKERDYKKLITHLDVEASQFLMIGNSLKSDILPVVTIGGNAIYVPYEITWMHEEVSEKEKAMHAYTQVEKLSDILKLF